MFIWENKGKVYRNQRAKRITRVRGITNLGVSRTLVSLCVQSKELLS